MRKRLLYLLMLLIFPFQSVFPVSNSFIDVRIATYNVISTDSDTKVAKGRFTAGTGAGQRLLYGFPNAISTSHTTIKIDAPGNTLLIFGSDAGVFTQSPVTYTSYDAFNNSKTSCTWVVTGKNIEVSQEITIIPNPRTGLNKDTLSIKYTVLNTNTFTAYVGARVMFDLQLGLADDSPITISGYGRVTQETKWTGAAVPDTWLTVDNIDNPQVKAEGYIKGPGATVPDQLVIGIWDNMKEGTNIWDYTMQPGAINDIAVAIYWFPVTVTAGGTTQFVTYYGIPDSSGAELGIEKTVDLTLAEYGDVLSYNISYSNTGGADLTNLYIWDSIPWNSAFIDASPGYNTWTASNLIFWPFPSDIISTGTQYDVWFRVSLTARTGLLVENRAASSYTDLYWNDKEVKNSNKAITGILTATITQTHTITPTHSITPTFTVTPTSTNTPVPLAMEFKGVFPNPSEKDVNFIIKLSRRADIILRVFSVSGEVVAKINRPVYAGQNAVIWDTKNTAGKKAASGVYIYILEAVTEKNERLKVTGKFSIIK